MTRKELTALAETAEGRTKEYLRAALRDPVVKEAVHRRYVPAALTGPAVANDSGRETAREAKSA